MREPDFWWRTPGIAAALLSPVAAGYGAITAQAFKRKGHRAQVPVLCVGNLTVGGSGKTPAAIAIASQFLAIGARPVFLTRGYGGRLAGPICVDPRVHRAADVGDEPLLLARVATTIVAHDRVAGATLAESIGNVIIMDDGFQNPSLSKDLALLVVDCRRGIGNGHMIPAGPLRAPLALQLDHADAVLLVGETNGAGNVIAQVNNRGLPIFHGRLQPNPSALAALKDHKVLAFAGIADPGKFFATLASAGVATAATASFPDHHRYTAQEARALLRRAERDALRLLTTEKDLVRLQGEEGTTDLAARATALPVTLVFEKEDAVRGLVLPLLDRRG